MNRTEFRDNYAPGSIVLSPYGLAVIEDVNHEPFKELPTPGDEGWPPEQEGPEFVAATIYVNGHGRETIEVDRLVPATPEAMATHLASERLSREAERTRFALDQIVTALALANDLQTQRRHVEGEAMQEIL